MISYIIQGVATTLLDPIPTSLVVLLYPSPHEHWDFHKPLVARPWLSALIKLATRHHQTNYVFGVAVTVARIIRLVQVAPVAEVRFIVVRAHHQLVLDVGSLFAMLAIGERCDSLSVCQVLLGDFYVCFPCGGALTALFMDKFPDSKNKVLRSITDSCFLDKNFPLPGVAIEQDRPGGARLTFALLLCGGLVLYCISVCVFLPR